MAFENLFIRTNKSIGGIKLDAVLQEKHVNELSVTKNPVEFGAEVTDHSRIEPKQVSVLAVVTDTPLGFAAVGELVDRISGIFGSSTEENVTRSVAAYEAMVALQENRVPLDLQTRLVLYKNMIITKIEVVQDKDSSREVVLNMSFSEMLIVNTEVVQLPPSQLQSGSVREQGSSPDSRGVLSGIIPNDPVDASVLKQVKDFIF